VLNQRGEAINDLRRFAAVQADGADATELDERRVKPDRPADKIEAAFSITSCASGWWNPDSLVFRCGPSMFHCGTAFTLDGPLHGDVSRPLR
jgi:hypothetical protein